MQNANLKKLHSALVLLSIFSLIGAGCSALGPTMPTRTPAPLPLDAVTATPVPPIPTTAPVVATQAATVSTGNAAATAAGTESGFVAIQGLFGTPTSGQPSGAGTAAATTSAGTQAATSAATTEAQSGDFVAIQGLFGTPTPSPTIDQTSQELTATVLAQTPSRTPEPSQTPTATFNAETLTALPPVNGMANSQAMDNMPGMSSGSATPGAGTASAATDSASK